MAWCRSLRCTVLVGFVKRCVQVWSMVSWENVHVSSVLVSRRRNEVGLVCATVWSISLAIWLFFFCRLINLRLQFSAVVGLPTEEVHTEHLWTVQQLRQYDTLLGKRGRNWMCSVARRVCTYNTVQHRIVEFNTSLLTSDTLTRKVWWY